MFVLSFLVTPLVLVLITSQLSWDFRAKFGEANVHQILFQLAMGIRSISTKFFFAVVNFTKYVEVRNCD